MNNGTISLPSSGTTALTLNQYRDVTLTGNSTFSTNGSANTININGTIAGTGQLIAAGGGTITLGTSASYTNTYSGGTSIVGGTTLAVYSDAGLGNVSGALNIVNGTLEVLGNMTTNRPIYVSALGSISDTQNFTLQLNDLYTWNSSTNSYTQVTNASSSDGGPAITTSNGASGFTLNGNSSTLDIQSGATLSGTGTVTPNIKIDNGGYLRPGNSPGYINASGDVSMGTLNSGIIVGGPSLVIDIDGTKAADGTPRGEYSYVSATGTFTIGDGAVITPLLYNSSYSSSSTSGYFGCLVAENCANFTPSIGQKFTIVQATGGIIGSFTSLTQPSGMATGTRMDALYTTTTITLYVTPETYANLSDQGVNLTSNQSAVGTAINALRPVAGVKTSTAMTDILAVLYNQTVTSLPSVMNYMAGTIYGDSLVAGVERSRMLGTTISDVLNSRRDDVAINVDDPYQATKLWASGFGQVYSLSAAGYTGATNSVEGGAAGIDTRLTNNVLVGVSVASGTGKTTSSLTGGTADQTTGHVTFYGSLSEGEYFLDAQTGVDYANTQVKRDMVPFGMIARSTTNGWGGNGDLAVGRRFKADGWTIQPSVGVRYDGLTHDSVQETGAGEAALIVNSGKLSSLRSTMAVRTETNFKVADGENLTPSLNLGWVHDYDGLNAKTTTAFVGASGTPMQLTSIGGGSDGALIGVHMNYSLNESVSLYGNYDSTVRANGTTYAGTIGIRYVW